MKKIGFGFNTQKIWVLGFIPTYLGFRLKPKFVGYECMIITENSVNLISRNVSNEHNCYLKDRTSLHK